MIFGLAIDFGGGFGSGFLNAIDSHHAANMAVPLEVLQLAGFAFFHVGLLMLVTCYGLWTFRKWGLTLAKVLAVIAALGQLLFFIAAIVKHAGIVESLASMIISAAILVYLFGRAELTDRAKKYVSQLRSHTTTPDWQKFE